MGEAQNQPFQLSFNPKLRVEFQGSRVTSDGGLLLVRELDERLGVSDLIAQRITDPRGKNMQSPEALEARGVKYAIRIPSNNTLEQAVAELLRRPVGRPSHRPVVRYKSIRYQAGSWKIARRVVAKIEFHCEELFPRVGSSSRPWRRTAGEWCGSIISAGRRSNGSGPARRR